MEIIERTVRAGELLGNHWLNGRPMMIAELQGSLVLVHFWDYTSAPAIRDLSHVKEWYGRYSEFGLKAVGVHTPEFPFAGNPEYVERALRRFGIPYPVVLDNDHRIRSSYGGSACPALYLVDVDGFVRYEQEGEGGYSAVERQIQVLLHKAGYQGELPELLNPLREADRPGAVSYRATPDLRTGYLRGALGNSEGYNPESILMYEDPGYHLDGRFYLRGIWFSDRHSMRLGRPSRKEAHVALAYNAVGVNAVLERQSNASLKIVVEQDGGPLSADICGEDTRVDDHGQSSLIVDDPRMYEIVQNKGFEEHELRLIIDGDGLSIYSISFDTAKIPDFSLIDKQDRRSRSDRMF